MSEKRFRVRFEQEDGRGEIVNEKGVELTAREVVDLLNKQQDTIITLRRRLEKINGGYGHLTHRNGLTANEWVIESQEKELKKKNEQIFDWIERHSKDIVKIGEQQAVIEKLQRSKAYWKKQCKEWEKDWEDLAYEFARVNNRNKELSKDLED